MANELQQKTKQYFAFISYKSEDVEWAIWLQHELEHYHLPVSFNGRTDVRQDLRPVFRDIDELSAGNLPEQIQQALKNSANLILVCSPLSAQSPWVNQEVENFIEQGKKGNIYPFIVEGQPYANNPDVECFPKAIRDLPKSEERLGGDATKQGRDMAFVKVVAGMLGVGFDDLWQRYEKEKAEVERKQREQRDNLLRLHSRLISEKANNLAEAGDSYLARRILLEIVPHETEHPQRPVPIEVEAAFRKACMCNSAILRGHSSFVMDIGVCQDGKTLCSREYDADRNVCLWSVETGQCIHVFERATHGDDLGNVIAVNTDSNIMAIGNGGMFERGGFVRRTKIKIIDISTKEVIKTIFGKDEKKEHKDSLQCLSFSPDNKLIAAVCEDNSIEIFEVSTGTVLNKITDAHSGQIFRVSFSPDGQWLVSASADCYIRMWNTKNGQCVYEKKHPDSVRFVDFSPAGNLFLATTEDNKIFLWETLSGQHIDTLDNRESANNGYICLCARFSPDGSLIVASAGKTIKIWDYKTKKVVQSITDLPDFCRTVSFIPHTNSVVAGLDDRTIRIFDLSENNIDCINYHYIITNNNQVLNVNERISNIGISRSGNHILSVSAERSYYGVPGDTNYLIRLFEVNTHNCTLIIKAPKSCHKAVFSIDGEYVISNGDDGLCFWDTKTGQCKKRIGNGYISSFAYSTDGRLIATHSGQLNIYDVALGQCVKTIGVTGQYSGSRGNCNDIVFSMDNKYLVNTDYSFFYVYDLRKGGLYFSGKHKNWVYKTAFSPDGKLLATSSGDETCVIWDLETKKSIQVLRNDSDCLCEVYFSKDSKYIISHGTLDTAIYIWDVQSGQCVLKFVGHKDCVNSIAFSPDGKKIYSGASDDTIKVWNFPTFQELINETRERFKEYPLTPDERRKYYLE